MITRFCPACYSRSPLRGAFVDDAVVASQLSCGCALPLSAPPEKSILLLRVFSLAYCWYISSCGRCLRRILLSHSSPNLSCDSSYEISGCSVLDRFLYDVFWLHRGPAPEPSGPKIVPANLFRLIEVRAPSCPVP